MTRTFSISARGVAADPDDVLFSGNRATQPEYDEYDPLLNGHSVTEPVAAAAAATAVNPDVGSVRRSHNANAVPCRG